MNGGFVSADLPLWNWLGITGKVTADHANDISTLGQNLTLTTFTGGPRVSLPFSRFTPFGEVLFGVARGTGSYFPSGTSSTSSASSFALAPGGGLDLNISPRFAIRVFDVQYLRTALPNGVENTQNQLQIGAGLVIRFGGSSGPREALSASLPQRSEKVVFTCNASSAEVTAGEPVQVIAQIMTLPGNQDVKYAWMANGRTINGDGPEVTIDTAGLPTGDYHISGHAALASDPSVSDDCTTSFRINQKIEQQAAQNEPAAMEQPVNTAEDEDFRAHMKDAFFNYDSYDLRPDAWDAIRQDTAYLSAHPDINITIAGYADERGSAEFNLALGLNRADSARGALISGGISPSRIQVMTYGKERPFCTDTTESCYQQNRRAQFVFNK